MLLSLKYATVNPTKDPSTRPSPHQIDDKWQDIIVNTSVAAQNDKAEASAPFKSLKKVKVDRRKLSVLQFKDFPDRKTVHLKFGGSFKK